MALHVGAQTGRGHTHGAADADALQLAGVEQPAHGARADRQGASGGGQGEGEGLVHSGRSPPVGLSSDLISGVRRDTSMIATRSLLEADDGGVSALRQRRRRGCFWGEPAASVSTASMQPHGR